jgi:hypothetical protein
MSDSSEKAAKGAEKKAERKAQGRKQIVIACLFFLGASVLLAWNIYFPSEPVAPGRKGGGALWGLTAGGYWIGLVSLVGGIQTLRRR